MPVKHKAQALAIHCIDFRFQVQFQKDLQERGLIGEVDPICWPGTTIDYDNVLHSAQLSLELHDPDELLIYEHEDCGAYGEDNSEATHRANAQKLAHALKETKPALQTTLLFQTFEEIKEL